MNVDIRKYIIDNFKDSDNDSITDSINEAIKDNEEITLPGLGVFFELLWTSSDNDLKKEIVNKIKNQLK